MCDEDVRQACTLPPCLCLYRHFTVRRGPLSLFLPPPQSGGSWSCSRKPHALATQGSGLVSPPAGRGLTATTALPQRLVPCACALGGGRLLLGSPRLPSSLRVRGSRGGGGEVREWGGGGGDGSDRGQARAAGRLSLVYLTVPRARVHSLSPSRSPEVGLGRDQGPLRTRSPEDCGPARSVIYSFWVLRVQG